MEAQALRQEELNKLTKKENDDALDIGDLYLDSIKAKLTALENL